jgi:uncharacterized damage-inducible protein DinB
MTETQKWFERKFEFTFPAELYLNLCMRLRGTPPRIEELVRDASREALTRKSDGKWSAQEHAGHLLDLESLWLARVHDFAANGGELTAADLTNRKTHEANHNARPIAEILADFRKSRLQLVGAVERNDSALLTRTLLHPRLKTPMRLVDHLYFVAEHDDHHLVWIWKLINGK